jgi:hypothetical protein
LSVNLAQQYLSEPSVSDRLPWWRTSWANRFVILGAALIASPKSGSLRRFPIMRYDLKSLQRHLSRPSQSLSSDHNSGVILVRSSYVIWNAFYRRYSISGCFAVVKVHHNSLLLHCVFTTMTKKECIKEFNVKRSVFHSRSHVTALHFSGHRPITRFGRWPKASSLRMFWVILSGADAFEWGCDLTLHAEAPTCDLMHTPQTVTC